MALGWERRAALPGTHRQIMNGTFTDVPNASRPVAQAGTVEELTFGAEKSPQTRPYATTGKVLTEILE